MLTFFFTSDLLKVIRSLADQDPGILMGFFLTLGLQALVLCLFAKYNNFKNSGYVVGVHMSFYVFMDLIKIFPGVKSF